MTAHDSKTHSPTLPGALGTMILWVTITLGGAIYQTGGNLELAELVANRLVYSIVLAGALLLTLTFFWQWPNLGWRMPDLHQLFVLWLPITYIFLFVTIAILKGLPPHVAIAYLAINTMFVGLSEELMFRGILYRAFIQRYSLWRTTAFVSLLFGAVHLANGFMTGDWLQAILQALATAMIGVAFLAYRVRTGSLTPCIIIHGLYDFSLFLLAYRDPSESITDPLEGSDATAGIAILLPLLLALPLLLHGAFLLRKTEKQKGAVETAPS
ncbi:MAG: hypothetical protein CMF59_04145 [Leptospiraceae bacterium]|nr:hypothetical protein [Leptospiraceae bacterium]